ncbi:MAG: hypothetical protein DIJKHBIC_01257 [Thermoanaerobaculia bacterium]|nr:hypothetical protein [Thermoanaerobaculia bacterium]
MRTQKTLLAGLLALAAAALAEDPATFTASLDRTSAELGDHVTATYEAVLPEGSRIEVEALVSPLLGEPGGGPVLDFPAQPRIRTEKTKSGLRSKVEVSFVPFQTGAIPVPAPKLVVVLPSGERRAVRPAQLLLQVASRLPKEKKPDELEAKADRPPAVPPISAWVWAALAAGLLAIAGLVWWILRRRVTAPQAGPAEPERTASEEFLAALEKLARSVPAPGSDARGYYSDLTHAIKRYLERRLEKPVLEWTTFETLRRLRELGLEFPQEIGLADLLGSADRVKFARAAATRAESESHLTRARALHDVLERRLAPPPETGAAAEPQQAKR